TVTLSNPSSTPVSFPFVLGGGSASPGDYVSPPTFSNGVTYDPATGTISVPANVTSFTVTVPTVQDTIDEPNETVPLSIGGVTGVGTIIDDDGTGTVPPTASPVAQTGVEDTPLVLTWAAFGAADVDTPPANLSIRISTLPADGVLTLGGVPVAVGLVIGKADIDAGRLIFTPDRNESGDNSFTSAGVGNLQSDYARFNYQVSDGSSSSATATLSIDIVPVADAPTLTISTGAPTVLFSNSWEAAPNADTTSDVVRTNPFEGWTRIDSPQGLAGGDSAFEVWTTGDSQQRQNGGYNTVVASPGNGRSFLELNDASRALDDGAFRDMPQTIGISRTIATQVGMVYDLSFDYAGRPGFGTEFTQIGVYVDGVLLQQYAATSPQAYIDWKELGVRFQGDGGTHTLTIRTDATQFNESGRGAFIDDIALTATRGVVAGNTEKFTEVGLAGYVSAALTDTDGSEALTVTISGIPGDGIIYTQEHGTYFPVGGSITIPASELATAYLLLDPAFTGHLSLGVTATATETSNGSSASTSGTIDIDVLAPFVSTDLGGDGQTNIVGTVGNDVLTGNGGAEYLMGQAGADTLSARAGNDYLDGGADADTLVGGSGNDVLYGGAGSDSLTGDGANGTVGADVFAWTLNDRGTPGSAPNDTVADFNVGNDVLDLRDLLVGENHAGAGTGNLTSYLHFESAGGGTVIHVSSTGGFAAGFNAAAEDQVITLTGVALAGTSDQEIIRNLLTSNKLVTD
ncbi:MAG: type I secretion C-terminal target domain-containing protein, partial [Rhodocyclaceae bacterium]